MATWSSDTPIKNYPGISEAGRQRLEAAGINTLGKLAAAIDAGRDDTATMATLASTIGVNPGSLSEVRNEVNVLTGNTISLSPAMGEIFDRHRTRLLSLGDAPSDLEINHAHAELLAEVGRHVRETDPGPGLAALKLQKTAEGARARVAAADLSGALELTGSAMTSAINLLETVSLPADLRATVPATIHQGAASLELVGFYLQSSLPMNLGASLPAMSNSLRTYQSQLTGMSVGVNPTVLISLQALALAWADLLEKLTKFWEWFKKKKDLIPEGGKKILKTLLLLWEFYEFMDKYGGAVFYCYRFCWDWQSHNAGYADFWACVKKCLDDKGVHPSDAIWDALKMIGVELLAKILDP